MLQNVKIKEYVKPIINNEINRLSKKFRKIDLSNSGNIDKSTFLGEEYKTSELYRTKHFTCVSLSKL